MTVAMTRHTYWSPRLDERIFILSILCLTACGRSDDNTGGRPADGRENTPPSISGSPPTLVTAGEIYSFKPLATDDEADALVFSIDQRPPWASFDSLDGSMTGQPTASDVGPHEGIVITVSDGASSTTLPAFNIEVTPIPAGSVVLQWTAPTHSSDGSVLDDLAGYRIRWGSESGSYRNVTRVNDSRATSARIGDLYPGTYFFVVTAIDTSSNESAFSNEVKVEIP